MENNNENNLDFQIDLLPVISLLAVCISFLLITAVWIQIGGSTISQAIGTESKDEKSLVLFADQNSDGSIQFTVQNNGSVIFKSNLGQNYLVPGSDSIHQRIEWIKKQYPELSSGIVNPALNTEVGLVVEIVDAMKRAEIISVGVSPAEV